MKKIYSFSFLVLILGIAGVGSILAPSKVYAGDSSGGLRPEAPKKVWAKSGPKAGEVTIYWEGVNYADRYGVAYGTKTNTYIYGAENIGGEMSRKYTVKSLTPGVKYYFRMIAAHNGASSPFSGEVWAVAAGGVVSTASMDTKVGAPTVKKDQAAAQPTVSAKTGGPVGAEKLWAKAGPKVGQVTLYWTNVSGAENYHLVYGTKAGSYQYGLLNMGNIRWFTVGYLTPGVKYYFALVPVAANGTPQYTTAAVAAWAKAPVVEVITTTKEALAQPKPKVTTTPKAMEKEVVPTGATGGAQVQPTTPAGQ
ncbi:fibronectin type III domain-containing protein [Candidatus Gottesmanbacteria bacterium]|nr:fibronectin type III domain-containing protein [Candidatus Gottesmanbacteria bacterium]